MSEQSQCAPLDGGGTQREPRSTARVKLALQPLKEAITAVEQHCEKFPGRFNGRAAP